jgi:hypothetical protein
VKKARHTGRDRWCCIAVDERTAPRRRLPLSKHCCCSRRPSIASTPCSTVQHQRERGRLNRKDVKASIRTGSLVLRTGSSRPNCASIGTCHGLDKTCNIAASVRHSVSELVYIDTESAGRQWVLSACWFSPLWAGHSGVFFGWLMDTSKHRNARQRGAAGRSEAENRKSGIRSQIGGPRAAGRRAAGRT